MDKANLALFFFQLKKPYLARALPALQQLRPRQPLANESRIFIFCLSFLSACIWSTRLVEMARSRGTASRFEWTTILYLVLVLVFPLALLGTVRAEEQTSLKDENNYGTVIGIDLGTTYSCVGVMHNGKVDIIVNDQGNRITPSYVAFTDEERLVGDAAKNQYAANPQRTVFDIK